MRSTSWIAGIALSVLLASPVSAQLFHKQRCEPCCPSELLLAPPSEPPLTPKGEPIPPPKGAEPAPAPMVESDFIPDLPTEPLTTFDSSVGYIDSAIPANIFRLRVDASYDINRGSRAEFLYASGAEGLPLAELKEDYQEIMAYLEGKVADNLSLFIETPVRFNNPVINANHAGFGDLNFGFKYAFQNCPSAVTSFQLRTWAPSGDSRKGLGNDHFTLEPGLLFYRRLSDRLRLEGELRYWIPLDGGDFAGDIFRYGIGLSYGERPACSVWVNPVVELVGWTVVDGLERVTPPLVPPAIIQDASGDTIVNIKLGVRLGLGHIADLYTGYGRALTGDVWYEDIWRTELRLAY